MVCGCSPGIGAVTVARVTTARTHALFRHVNDRIRELASSDAWIERFCFMCECADDSCTAALELTLAEYDSARSRPAAVLLLPGHRIAGVGRVRETSERFAVVEIVRVVARPPLVTAG